MNEIDFVCAWLNCKPEDVLSAHSTIEGGFSAVIDKGIDGAPKFVLTPDQYREALEKFQAGKAVDRGATAPAPVGAVKPQGKLPGKVPGKARKGK